MFDFKFEPNITLSPQSKAEKYLHLIRKATCFFQGHFIDYSIVASLRHKEIRLYQDRSEGESKNLAELHVLKENLVSHCNRNLDAAFRKSAEFMHEYFEIDNRHKNRHETVRPRICVKICINGKIADLFRDRGPTKVSSFPAKENTGFDSIIQDGKHYICNDIPSAVKKRLYYNKRLDPQSAGEYRIPSKYKKYFHLNSSMSHMDPEWEKCWDVGTQKRPSPETCYKSTLIVPMTLRGADLSPDFQKHLKLDGEHEKSTFGYLCFDHQLANFFREDDDIHVGYYFADMLSLYMINRKNYLENSCTIKKANGLLS